MAMVKISPDVFSCSGEESLDIEVDLPGGKEGRHRVQDG